MLVTALTGGIATGKSVVSQIFKDLGCFIHKADEAAHTIMLPGGPAYKKIVDHFGPEILHPDDTIDRQKLGHIVFSHKKELHFLNSIIHPLILAEKEESIQRVSKDGNHKIFISEAALTIEAGYSDLFDKIIMTFCQGDDQIRRLMKRDQIPKKAALQKIQAQMPLEKKMSYADYLIDTSGTINQTIEQTERVFRQLLHDYELKINARKGENT